MGQFYERVSEYVETPISVTALAVECSETCGFLLLRPVEVKESLMENIRKL